LGKKRCDPPPSLLFFLFLFKLRALFLFPSFSLLPLSFLSSCILSCTHIGWKRLETKGKREKGKKGKKEKREKKGGERERERERELKESSSQIPENQLGKMVTDMVPNGSLNLPMFDSWNNNRNCLKNCIMRPLHKRFVHDASDLFVFLAIDLSKVQKNRGMISMERWRSQQGHKTNKQNTHTHTQN